MFGLPLRHRDSPIREILRSPPLSLYLQIGDLHLGLEPEVWSLRLGAVCGRTFREMAALDADERGLRLRICVYVFLNRAYVRDCSTTTNSRHADTTDIFCDFLRDGNRLARRSAVFHFKMLRCARAGVTVS